MNIVHLWYIYMIIIVVLLSYYFYHRNKEHRTAHINTNDKARDRCSLKIEPRVVGPVNTGREKDINDSHPDEKVDVNVMTSQ